jgi:predicted transcriptional regulator
MLRLGKAFAHPKRQGILLALLREPRTFQDIKAEVGLQKSALSNHLAMLSEANLVEKYQHGVYRITQDGLSLLDSISRVIDESRTRRMKVKEAEMRRRMVESFLRRKVES